MVSSKEVLAKSVGEICAQREREREDHIGREFMTWLHGWDHILSLCVRERNGICFSFSEVLAPLEMQSVLLWANASIFRYLLNAVEILV